MRKTERLLQIFFGGFVTFGSMCMLAVSRDVDHHLLTDTFFRTLLVITFFLGLWLITQAERHF